MSVPPLPNDPDELNNEQGDYVEVPYNSLLEGNIYIFYNQWTLEMIRVDIMNVSYHDDNDIEIKYKIVNDNGDYVSGTEEIDNEYWTENGMKAFRYIPPEITHRGGTKRKRKNKKSNKSKKYKKSTKYKKSKKSRKIRK